MSSQLDLILRLLCANAVNRCIVVTTQSWDTSRVRLRGMNLMFECSLRSHVFSDLRDPCDAGARCLVSRANLDSCENLRRGQRIIQISQSGAKVFLQRSLADTRKWRMAWHQPDDS